jgi:hypothetical protein
MNCILKRNGLERNPNYTRWETWGGEHVVDGLGNHGGFLVDHELEALGADQLHHVLLLHPFADARKPSTWASLSLSLRACVRACSVRVELMRMTKGEANSVAFFLSSLLKNVFMVWSEEIAVYASNKRCGLVLASPRACFTLQIVCLVNGAFYSGTDLSIINLGELGGRDVEGGGSITFCAVGLCYALLYLGVKKWAVNNRLLTVNCLTVFLNC